MWHVMGIFAAINSQNPHIQFTMEDPGKNGALPLLDTLVSLGPNNTQVTSVYRKLIHIDQYLHRDSSHFPQGKYSINNTLA